MSDEKWHNALHMFLSLAEMRKRVLVATNQSSPSLSAFSIAEKKVFAEGNFSESAESEYSPSASAEYLAETLGRS